MGQSSLIHLLHSHDFVSFYLSFVLLFIRPPAGNRLVGLVVKASASGVEDPGFESRLRRDFSGSSDTSDLKIGTPRAL